MEVVKRFLRPVKVAVAVKTATVKAGTLPSLMMRQAQTS